MYNVPYTDQLNQKFPSHLYPHYHHLRKLPSLTTYLYQTCYSLEVEVLEYPGIPVLHTVQYMLIIYIYIYKTNVWNF